MAATSGAWALPFAGRVFCRWLALLAIDKPSARLSYRLANASNVGADQHQGLLGVSLSEQGVACHK